MPQGIDPPRCGSRRLPSPFPDEIVGRCAPSIVNIKALPAETRADACERPPARRWSMFVTRQIQSWPPRTVRGKILPLPTRSQAATIAWDGTNASWNTTTNWSTSFNATTPDRAAVPGAHHQFQVHSDSSTAAAKLPTTLRVL